MSRISPGTLYCPFYLLQVVFGVLYSEIWIFFFVYASQEKVLCDYYDIYFMYRAIVNLGTSVSMQCAWECWDVEVWLGATIAPDAPYLQHIHMYNYNVPSN